MQGLYYISITSVTAWIHIRYFLFDGLYQMKTQDLHWHFTQKGLEILASPRLEAFAVHKNRIKAYGIS